MFKFFKTKFLKEKKVRLRYLTKKLFRLIKCSIYAYNKKAEIRIYFGHINNINRQTRLWDVNLKLKHDVLPPLNEC